jgi:hypothetical protein
VTSAPLLREVIDFAAKPEPFIKGFQACGLHPLNANAVDYTKCLGQNGIIEGESPVCSVVSRNKITGHSAAEIQK